MAGFTDLVLTELRKAGPDGLSKEDLQKNTGLGPQDLREALGEAADQAFVVERDRGDQGTAYVHADFTEEDAPGGDGTLPIPDDAQQPDRSEEARPPAETLEGNRGFRATVEMTFEFKSDDPRHAVADAKTLVEDAKNGVLRDSPSVGISTANLQVTEFAERRIWPAPAES